MRKHILALSIFCLSSIQVLHAQNNVGINTNTPHATAALDIQSTDKGVLIPRLTFAQRNAISAPATGLLIYQTDNTAGFYYFNGSSWTAISSNNSNFSLPYLGSDGSSISFRVNNTSSQSGIGIMATSQGNLTNAVLGNNSGTGGMGVRGISSGQNSMGVLAIANTDTSALALKAQHTSGGTAIEAITNASTSGYSAIEGTNTGSTGFGVKGISNAFNTAGIRGESTNGVGVNGFSSSSIAVAGSSVSGTALKGNSSIGYALETAGNLRLYGGNTNPSNGAVLTSDAVGNAVWKPNKVGFFVQHAKNVSMGSNQQIKVEFQNEVYDAQNDFEPYAGTTTNNSSKFTAPVSGLYHFSASGLLTLTSNVYNLRACKIHLMVNGVKLGSSLGNEYSTSSESNSQLAISATIHLNAGDKVWIEAQQNNIGGIATGFDQVFTTFSFFSGHLIYAD